MCERFADIQMLRYRVGGWERLSLRQKLYAYCLSEATLWGRDITFDQFGRYNLLVRSALEAAWTHRPADGGDADGYRQLHELLRRVWFSNGIYHHYGCQKFRPGFDRGFFLRALRRAQGSLPGGRSAESVAEELDSILFDDSFLPKRVNKADGDDLVRTSACNYYEGVSQREVEQFYAAMKRDETAKGGKEGHDGRGLPSFGLNSRLTKDGHGAILEDKWTVSGRYGAAISHIVGWLRKAASVAENDRQRKVIGLLVRYYETGDLRLFDDYSIEWLQEQAGDIDFINGFIEVYGDPLGLKGSWEGIVELKDNEATRRTSVISGAAQWFEDHSPVDARFRKPVVKGVTAHVVNAVMLGGDEYPSSAIGINLPNADWIRARYGSKSVTIGNLTEACNKAARGNGFMDEFVIDDDTCRLIDTYGDACDDLHTDLHECLGHGSGRLLPGTDPDALKAYGNTIEEARADLFGLYFIADEKLLQLGLLTDKEAYKSQYYTYMMNGLMTQLARIEPGHHIEEAHMLNRALIARWALDRGEGCVEMVSRGGKTYVRINDYGRLRSVFASQLAEIQRIKSEGDYDAARRLVETYAVKVDQRLLGEVHQRYDRLHIAPYKGFINPRMTLRRDERGEIVDVELDYTETYDAQMLRYSHEYGLKH